MFNMLPIRHYMQMHCRFLICASNGWLSTCNSNRCDPVDAEGVFQIKTRMVDLEEHNYLGAANPQMLREFRSRQEKTKVYSCPSSYKLVCTTRGTHARVCVYMFLRVLFLTHSHREVHACLICGNFVVPLLPSREMGN